MLICFFLSQKFESSGGEIGLRRIAVIFVFAFMQYTKTQRSVNSTHYNHLLRVI
jgi:hypothetical protein